MKPITNFKNPGIKVLFTDIDDTLTHQGRLQAEAYDALWQLHNANIAVVPVTGRPAGWCELIARQWPVAGVIGENGGLYFRYHEKKMHRHYAFPATTRKDHRSRLELVKAEVLQQVPGAALASDQFCREMDLAIDYCEDVAPLDKGQVQKIVDIFTKHGATVKVSSIHVNGWFGDYDKLTMCKAFAETELQIRLDTQGSICAFVGDSPNDEPLFEYFENSFAVANVNRFVDDMSHLPKYVAKKEGGLGFAEIAKRMY
ncbi:MAG: HAD-IIB family hydrolase [Pseudobdellovibrionaceae bacterium]|nr:HAD-IIB family hydrolase [Bdellovibrionales bacterium]USN46114.1 MAG: HAD-IIB family hydrolase [Pseudobdellovibrionaceae bacterium]